MKEVAMYKIKISGNNNIEHKRKEIKIKFYYSCNVYRWKSTYKGSDNTSILYNSTSEDIKKKIKKMTVLEEQ